ncbi:LpqB family beta-propeller domain-containing protein [Nonomuraea terrae]|uniref:LpqB family beta-propeller domain-containing protein n=1 Tax=Nonomuraea terrae TaxID=2530383 RepID=UPI0037B8FF95
MTRTRRFAAVTAIMAAVTCAGSGCTVIPLSGPIAVSDVGAGDPLGRPFQRMIAIGPQREWGPEETIKGMQAAMAAYPDDPSVLQQYLTPEAKATWNASGPVTVIDDAFEIVAPPPGDGTETVQTVTLKGSSVASIKEDDSYVPTAGAWERPYELVKAPGGGYRVNALPPGLLLTASDVDRAYRPTNLYYLNRSTQDRLVVDRVRLRMKTTERFAQTVLERLLQQPTAALQGAVSTSFPPGTAIESVRSGEERVVIDLASPLDPLDLSAEDALRAQIRYTLNNNDVAKGRIIEIQVNGEPYAVDRPNSDEHWLDDSGDHAYYVSRGAVRHLGKDRPEGVVPGAAGEPREGYSDFAMSLSKDGPPQVAALTTTGISVASLTPDGRWQEVIHGESLTPPTWHRDGSLWTYDRDNAVLLRYDPAHGQAPERVSAPEVEKLDVTRLRIARDGVRVAVTTGKNTVQIGALTGGGTMLGNLQLLTTIEMGSEITDVAWGDDEHLLVLVQTKAGQILNEINVGDGETTGVPLKDRLESVAALDDRILAEAETEKGTKLLELNQDRQTWATKLETDAGAPLFPLG